MEIHVQPTCIQIRPVHEFRYLSQQRAVEALASLHIYVDSPERSLLPYTKYVGR